MQVNEYPAAIEATACQVAQLEANITNLKLEVNGCELEADLSIAFDAELKNDNQRKAKRAELLTKDARYSNAQKTIIEASQQKACTQARLEALRNEFELVREAKAEAPLNLAEKSSHYLAVTIAPDAKYDWERLQFQDPVTRETLDFASVVAKMVADKGQFLIQLDMNVKVLTATSQAD
jgi:hypothetical protein